LAEQLQSQVFNPSRPLSVRIESAAAFADSNEPPSDQLFEFLLDQCASRETEVVHRLAIARALGNAKLTPAQLERMTQIVSTAGPLELPSILKAYEDAASPAAGEKLFAALQKSPGTKVLAAVRLQRLVERYPKSEQAAAADLLKKISADTQSQAARMKELELCLTGGDLARGSTLFAGKAACSQCHKIDNQGSKIGPDLSQIGAIRTRRDLVEAIAFPSATFARGFEPVSVIVNGRPLNGVLARETAKEVFLMTADRATIAVPRDDIEDIIPSRISIMPQGLDRNLTPEELRDLVAYLSSRGGEKNAGASSN
jgi:putative heme-binding domain-containing protein